MIIRNLLQNAVKYIDNARHITISANNISMTINQSAKANADELNALLNSKQVDSKRSGLGLQIANDLAISIGAKIFFEQKNNTTIPQYCVGLQNKLAPDKVSDLIAGLLKVFSYNFDPFREFIKSRSILQKLSLLLKLNLC